MACECLVQSRGVPEIFTLANDGRKCELRRGCLVDSFTREVLTSSDQTTSFLLSNALLSHDEHLRWAEFGPDICASAAAAANFNGWGACK